MKYYELDKTEEKLSKDYDTGKFESAKVNKRKYIEAARHTLNKSKNINVRIAEKDLLKIKARAVKTGIPYQTIVSTLIHQYANGDLKIEI